MNRSSLFNPKYDYFFNKFDCSFGDLNHKEYKWTMENSEIEITLTCQASWRDFTKIIDPLFVLRKEIDDDDEAIWEDGFIGEIRADFGRNTMVFPESGDMEIVSNDDDDEFDVAFGDDVDDILRDILDYRRRKAKQLPHADRFRPNIVVFWEWEYAVDPPENVRWGPKSLRLSALAEFKITFMCQFPMENLPKVLDPFFVLREKIGFIGEIRTGPMVFPVTGATEIVATEIDEDGTMMGRCWQPWSNEDDDEEQILEKCIKKTVQ